MVLGQFDPRFRSITLTLLKQLPDTELASAVQQHVFMRVNDDPEREAEILASLPNGVRAVYAGLILDAQVQNGGFNQFFWNSARFAEAALTGLQELGAKEHADLLRQAMDTAISDYGELLPYYIEGSVRAFSGSYHEGIFDDLDSRYHELPHLEGLLARAIRDQPERFCSP